MTPPSKTLAASLFALLLTFGPVLSRAQSDEPFGASPSGPPPSAPPRPELSDPFSGPTPGRGGGPPPSRPAVPLPPATPDVDEFFRRDLDGAPAARRSARFDVDFSEATVAEACEFIRFKLEKVDPENPFNIVVSKEATDIVLPSMQLRKITFEQFARFINRIGGASELEGGASDDPFAPDDSRSRGIPQKGDRFGISDTEGIWYFWAERIPTDAKAEAAKRLLTKTFHVGDGSEPTLSLIEEALEASQKASGRKGPTLAFHEASKSLIVNGHTDDLKLIEDVVASMRERHGSKRETELEKEILRYQQELQEMHRKAEFQNRMSEEEKLQLKRQLETRVLGLESQLIEARTKFSGLHPKIKELEAQLAEALAAKEANR